MISIDTASHRSQRDIYIRIKPEDSGAACTPTGEKSKSIFIQVVGARHLHFVGFRNSSGVKNHMGWR